jgi:hypothetical protein
MFLKKKNDNDFHVSLYLFLHKKCFKSDLSLFYYLLLNFIAKHNENAFKIKLEVEKCE